MLTLAQLPEVEGPAFLAWLASAALALFLLNQAITFWKEHLREKPIPGETYATKVEHNELRQRLDAVDGKIEANFRELDRKRSVSIAGLHDDLTAKTEAIRAEMKHDAEGIHARMSDILGAVHELKGRIQK
jgi:hypothetical protein